MGIVPNVPPAFPGFGHKRKGETQRLALFKDPLYSLSLFLFWRTGKRGQILHWRTHVKERAPLAVTFYPDRRVITGVWLRAGNFDFVRYQRSVVVKLQGFPIAGFTLGRIESLDTLD